ncbi:MAG: nucleoside monophosphate kinase [Bdellovibrionales bacterium]|nr:nucleoside monophosphate kinase [Bdellovibrionales bacterium]
MFEISSQQEPFSERSCDGSHSESLPSISESVREESLVRGLFHFGVISLLGSPAAGKGTQSRILSSEYGPTHISTGDLVRHEISSNGPRKATIESLAAQGKLIPDEIVMDLLRKRLSHIDREKGVVLDGCPRTAHQALLLPALLEEFGMRLSGVLELNVPEKEAHKRLLTRIAQGSTREDDTPEKLTERYKEYLSHANALQRALESICPISQVDASSSLEETTQILRTTLAQLAKHQQQG